MTAIQHPAPDALLHLASGQAEPAAAQHLEGCPSCRQRVSDLRGVLSVAREELLEDRPFCPSPDELAAHGTTIPHPHLEQCPLCREEVRIREALDREPLRSDPYAESLPSPAPWMSQVEPTSPGVAYLDAGVGDRLKLELGQSWRSRVGEVSVSLECTGKELRVDLEGGGVVLVLGDENLEKRVPLDVGEHRFEVGTWRWARIEAREGC